MVISSKSYCNVFTKVNQSFNRALVFKLNPCMLMNSAYPLSLRPNLKLDYAWIQVTILQTAYICISPLHPGKCNTPVVTTTVASAANTSYQVTQPVASASNTVTSG